MKRMHKGQNLSHHRGADLAYHDAAGILLPPAHAHTHLTKAIKRKKDQEVRKAMEKNLQAKGRMKGNLRES
jgi:DNA-binding GntR family transcriptional regulator